MSREYRFDRYWKGRKMAEGLVLTKPTTVEQAMETVYLLAGPSDTFVLREDLACLAVAEAERDAARAGEARAVEALRKIKDMAGEEAGKDSTYGLLMQFAYLALETAECALDDSQPALDWLAQQRREAAVVELEEFADDSDGIQELIPCNISDLRSALRVRAAALRAGEVGNE